MSPSSPGSKKTILRKRVQKHFTLPSRTKQSFKDETDINRIMAGYLKGQPVTHLATSAPQFGDFTQVTDYRTALHQVMEAQEAFDQLPAKLRERFSNDPGQFVAFATDPANQDEIYALGLAEKPTPPEPAPEAPEPPPEGE